LLMNIVIEDKLACVFQEISRYIQTRTAFDTC